MQLIIINLTDMHQSMVDLSDIKTSIAGFTCWYEANKNRIIVFDKGVRISVYQAEIFSIEKKDYTFLPINSKNPSLLTLAPLGKHCLTLVNLTHNYKYFCQQLKLFWNNIPTKQKKYLSHKIGIKIGKFTLFITLIAILFQGFKISEIAEAPEINQSTKVKDKIFLTLDNYYSKGVIANKISDETSLKPSESVLSNVHPPKSAPDIIKTRIHKRINSKLNIKVKEDNASDGFWKFASDLEIENSKQPVISPKEKKTWH